MLYQRAVLLVEEFFLLLFGFFFPEGNEALQHVAQGKLWVTSHWMCSRTGWIRALSNVQVSLPWEGYSN